MDKHYRPRAAVLLRKEKRHFRLKDWTRRRRGLDYERRSNLTLHDGLEYRFDFRGPLATLFVLKEDGLKKILAVGGFGSSGGRLNYTLFTAIFYLLGRQKSVRHHLILYDRFNRFKFLRTYRRPLVTVWLGMNYPLDKGLAAEIRKAGVDFSKVQEKFPGIK
jgi:hypothetical protein